MQRGVDIVEEIQVQEAASNEDNTVVLLATDYFNNGLYCSEAILRAFNEVYNLGLSPSTYKIATGFGSGMGETGCACGAVTSCVMVLGLVAGRNHKSESEALVYEAVKNLQKEFQSAFKSTCCRVLTKNIEWGSKVHNEQCENMVAKAAQITQRILETDLKAYLPENGSKKIPKKWSLKRVGRKARETFNHHFSGTK